MSGCADEEMMCRCANMQMCGCKEKDLQFRLTNSFKIRTFAHSKSAHRKGPVVQRIE